MKKNIIIAILGLAVFSGFGYTGNLVKDVVSTLKSTSGNELLHPGAVGKSYVHLTSTTGVVACTGKCLLFDIIMSSGASTSYATISDTYTAETASNYLFKNVPFDGKSKSMSASSPAFPIMCDAGIIADLSSVSTNEEILIIYKDMD